MFGVQVERWSNPTRRIDALQTGMEIESLFRFLKQAYLLTSDWCNRVVQDTRGVDAHTRQKAEFYLRQLTDALSPANFVLTNRSSCARRYLRTPGNLVSGMRISRGLETGHGRLKIRQTDPATFEVAAISRSLGKVIYQNELMQLIQYTPTTRTVSSVRSSSFHPGSQVLYPRSHSGEILRQWCVDQGLTVFVISWVNPDAKLAARASTTTCGKVRLKHSNHRHGDRRGQGSPRLLRGGTLLAALLAYMAAKGDKRASSATLLTRRSTSPMRATSWPSSMKSRSSRLSVRCRRRLSQRPSDAETFSLLRSNDLIWPY